MALTFHEGQDNHLFQEAGSQCSIAMIQDFLTSLEAQTKLLEYNLEQCFLLLGVFQ